MKKLLLLLLCFVGIGYCSAAMNTSGYLFGDVRYSKYSDENGTFKMYVMEGKDKIHMGYVNFGSYNKEECDATKKKKYDEWRALENTLRGKVIRMGIKKKWKESFTDKIRQLVYQRYLTLEPDRGCWSVKVRGLYFVSYAKGSLGYDTLTEEEFRSQYPFVK